PVVIRILSMYILKLPVGTDVKHTDSITRILEKRVEKVLEKEKPGVPGGIVESIITNVAVSANNPRDNNRSVQSNLGPCPDFIRGV
ncbi:MAG: hypothetical protein V9F01_18715, partial [Chitinophagaceae bacterium]